MLNKILMGSLMTALALTFGCTRVTQAPGPDVLIEGAKKLDAAFATAFNAHDVDAMMALYWNDPEVISFPPDRMTAHGLTEIKDYYVRSFQSLPAGAKLEITDAHYVPVGDVVMGWGTYRFSMMSPDGKLVESLGRFSDVKAERNGKWVFLMDHGSVPEMPPPPPPPPAKKK